MVVTGYKYQNINAANGAKNALRAYFLDGRPQGNYVTNEWVEVKQDAAGFYYFLGNYAPVLGNPSTFEITINKM